MTASVVAEATSSPKPPASGTTIQSVSRASKILILSATTPGGVTPAGVAERLSLSLPTVYHLLNTLAAEGLLAKDNSRRYVLGPASGVIAEAVMKDTYAPEYMLEPLNELAYSTGETAYLSVRRRGDIHVLATVEGSHAVRVMGIETGASGYEHARASGKLLLALSGDDVREMFFSSHELLPRTDHTITTRSGLEAEFEEIRRAGVAYDREEYAVGVTCISAPILVSGVPVGAFTVSAPSERFRMNADLIRTSILTQAAVAAGSAPALI